MKPEYKTQLVDALLKCPCIRDRDTRNALINELPDSIRNAILRNPANRVDVINIVTRCLDFQNGIVEAGEIKSGNVKVGQEAETAKNMTGVKVDRIG